MSPAKSLALILPLNAAIIAAAVVRGIGKADKPGLYFGEGRFTMILSCAQLLAIAFFSLGVFRARRRSSPARGWLAPHNLWLLIGAGFLFLTTDEIFQIHESADRFTHTVLGLAETPLTDRLDDLMVGSYLVIGLATLWIFRGEMKPFRPMILPLVCGFACGGISVVCDILGQHEDIFLMLGADRRKAGTLVQWADVGDGAFTLLGEACFVAAFFVGWLMSRAAAPGRPETGEINARPTVESR